MTEEIPAEVRALVARREAARRRRDFRAADSLRDRIREAGFDLRDRPDGPLVLARQEPPPPGPPVHAGPEEVPSLLHHRPVAEASVQWVVEGGSEEVRRAIRSFADFASGSVVQLVVVDLTDDPGPWPERVDVVRLGPGAGWAAARNAGLRRSAGRVVVLVDASVEPLADPIQPILDALSDPGVGVTGPFGLVSDDLREFRPSDGPEVDAVEAYLMAFRRDLVERGLRFDPGFRFYRMADVDLCFRIRAMELRATVTPLPVVRHEHRTWATTPEEVRARLSKRNFYRFLDRWRGRTDLLVSRRETSGG